MGHLFCPEKPGPLGLRLRFQPVGLTGRRVEPTPRRARSEIDGSALLPARRAYRPEGRAYASESQVRDI